MKSVVLGPQRPEPNLREALDAEGIDAPLLAITAGWRHDEGEVDALRAAVGRPLHLLPVYAWFEDMYLRAPEVLERYAARQRRIRAYKDLYRLRVRAALGTLRALWQRLEEDPALVGAELERAVQAVRRIDDEALETVDAIRAEFPEVGARFEVPAIAARREEARGRVADVGAVLIAGGHVAVLRNRLLFFGVEHALTDATVFAWGAGSMLLADRIVLYYDDPPEGPGEAEVLDRGLGFVPGTTFFPHARDRLRLDDRPRVAALARRFGTCVALENGAWLAREGERWVNRGEAEAASLLRSDGTARPL